MNIKLPTKVNRIISELNAAGFEAYAVGGCIRDSILGRPPTDWDITTSALPAQIKTIFKKTIDTGIKHGTVTVMISGEGFEVTTYRIDGKYEDGRHPTTVIFTPNLIEDLKRRDFTINAMAYNEQTGLVDLFHGAADLNHKIIRCVGNAHERFAEDTLRMLRAVRFSAQMGFVIEENTKAAICELSPSLVNISAERIQVELVKLVTSEHPKEFMTVYQTGLSKVFYPQFDEMMKTAQNNPHHCYNVGEHTVKAMGYVPPDKILRLTMLFHDVGKPACKQSDEKGIDHFKDHPRVGAQITKQLMRKLKFDNETIAKVTTLVKWHDDNPVLTATGVRRALNRIGEEHFPALFFIKRADTMAKSPYRQKEMFAYIDAFEKQYEEILKASDCINIRNLKVNGNDLIGAGIAPGPEIGKRLEYLLKLVLEHPEYNEKEILLEKLSELE
jgi:tRNA nucleotidyltransferase (CCA-adding enzyme)